MKTFKSAKILLLTIVCCSLFACQSHTIDDISSSLILGNTAQQILVTFSRSKNDNWMPGGSTKSYHAGESWSAPLRVQRKIKSLEKKFNLSKSTVWPIEALDVYCVVFTISSNTNIEKLINSIRIENDVVEAQKMNEFSVMADTGINSRVYNDPQFDLQYGHHTKAIEQLHSISRGEEIRIGIIDTPVDTAHQDLLDQVTAQFYYVPKNNLAIAKAHGTAVAGIISAKSNNLHGLVGLAPKARLYVYGACYRNDTLPARCNSLNLLQAVEQAIEDKVDILNLSLAGPHDALLEKLLKIALNQKMIIVAARADSSISNFPASMSGVYGVASQDMSPENLALLESNLETFDSWILKGEKLSTQSGGGHQFFYGSSMTSASVSGLAALLKAKMPKEDIDIILKRFTNHQCMPANGTLANNELRKIEDSKKCEEIYIKLLKNRFQLLTRRD